MADFRNLYGRRLGRPLRPAQKAALKNQINHAPDDKFYQNPPDKLWLEIGFGGGEHLVFQGKKHPNVTILGVEFFLNGVASALAAIENEALNNVKVVNGDARDVLDKLPPNSLDKVFILNPDPWPKARHHRRRIVNHELFKQLHKLMKEEAELLLATDHEDYLVWMLEHILETPYFHWTAKSHRDWSQSPDNFTTRYQAKAKKERRKTAFLRCTRKK